MSGTEYDRQGKIIIITFILHRIPNSFHVDHNFPWLLWGGLWVGPKTERRGINASLEDHVGKSHIFENPPHQIMPDMCIPKIILCEKRKLPQVCLALSVLASHSSLKKKSRFSRFDYREIRCTTFFTPFWDPRNFHPDPISRWPWAVHTQDVGGRCTSI